MPNSKKIVINTHCGLEFNLLNPRPEHINFADVAEQLAKLCRFAGATQMFYSVAQHTLMVADLVNPSARPYALMHDAHEAYLGDWPTPVKQALSFQGGGDALRRLENTIASALHNAAGLDWPVPEKIARQVKKADLQALATERANLLTPSKTPWPQIKGVHPHLNHISPMSWPDAATALFSQFANTGIIAHARSA